MIRNIPDRWDLEADFVSVGSGGGGLAAAIAAHDHGASALVLEASDQVGGVTAYSMGEVWVPGNHHAAALGLSDSVASGIAYVRSLAAGYAEDALIVNQAIHAPLALRWFEDAIGLKMAVIRDCPDYYYRLNDHATPEGRLLEAEPFAGASLGEWQSRTRVSPHVPYGLNHAEISDAGGTAHIAKWPHALMGERLMSDTRCLGPALAAYFVKGALDRAIPLHTNTAAAELIGDGARIIGVRARHAGRDLFVKANKGVLIATSSYERSPDYTRTLGLQLDVQSVIMPQVDGAHLRLAGKFGARVARVPDVTMLGFQIPGEELEEGVPFWRNAMAFMGLPHTIVVNREGRRFANEAFYRSIYFAVDAFDGQTQSHPNFPAWIIFDDQARAKYPFGSLMPGQDFPEGFGITAGTLEEIATRTGINAAGLAATIAHFNTHAAQGQDPVFARGQLPWGAWMAGDRFHQPNPNLGPLTLAPYNAVELSRRAQRLESRAAEAWDELSMVLRQYGAVIDRAEYARLTTPEEASGA